MVSREDWVIAGYNKVLDNIRAIEKLRAKDAEKLIKLDQHQGFSYKIMKLFLGGNSSKEISKLERSNERLQRSSLKGINVFIMPGYVLQRKYKKIGESSIYRTILTKCRELYGRKHARNKSLELVAGILSYPIIGISASLGLGILILGAGNFTAGLAIIGFGSIIVLVVVYALYDELGDKLNKRHDAIQRQFPNVVSKLALLVTSGMIMDRAWQETAGSNEGELYVEMRRTSEELTQNISPEDAYAGFLNRCNTKETSKLASAIMQNLSKGNAEIGHLLKDMAYEAWQERRHTAKRDAEKANSKLMIPTMLLLLAILVMIMVPVAMNFTNL